MRAVFYFVPLTGALIILASSFTTGNHEAGSAAKHELHYAFDQPDEVHILPTQLTEVSGLTDFSATEIACVQDEKGVVFTYDLVSKASGPEFTFAGDGDYEGLTRVDEILFSLTSEGTLYEIKSGRKEPDIEVYELGLSAPDNEGLCYDEQGERLLIAPKSKLGKGPEFKDMRAVFAFDLKKRKMEKEPLFSYHVSDIYAYAAAHALPVHPSYKKNGESSKHPNFRPSSLAVHPLTQEIYIISAEDLCLVIFDKKGTITGFSSLDPDIFSKPEGLTFFPDGTMVITNEGVNGPPTAVVLKPRD